MGVYNIVYSEEDYEEFEKVALEMIENEKPFLKDIKERLGVSKETTKKVVEQLIDKKLIAPDALEIIRVEKVAERNEQTLAKKRAEKEKRRQIASAKDELKRQEKERIIKIVADALNKKMKPKEILQLEIITFGYATLRRIIREVERRNLLVDDSSEAVVKNNASEVDKTEKVQVEMPDDYLKNMVRRLYLIGLQSNIIYKELNISKDRLQEIKKALIDEHRITEDKIKEAREKRKIRNKRRTLIMLKKGYEQKEIAKKIKFISETAIGEIVKVLKQEGTITDEAIENAKKDRKNREILAKLEEKYDEKIVIRARRLLLIGLKSEVICEELNIGNIELEDIKTILRMKGKITEDKIKEAREKRKIRNKRRILIMRKKGYTYEEITKRIRFSTTSSIGALVEEMKAEGEITNELEREFEQARAERREEEEKETMEFIYSLASIGRSDKEIANYDKNRKLTPRMVSIRIQKLKDIGRLNPAKLSAARASWKKEKHKQKMQNYIGPHDDRAMQLAMFGFETRDIAKLLNVGKSYVSQIKKRLKGQGKIEQKDLDVAIENRELNAEERRAAIEEMSVYEEDLDLEVVKGHIEYTMATSKLGEMNKADIRILRRVIPISNELINLTNVEFAITDFLEKGNFRQAIKFVDKCLESIYDEQEVTRKNMEKLRTELEGKYKIQQAKKFSKKRSSWKARI